MGLQSYPVIEAWLLPTRSEGGQRSVASPVVDITEVSAASQWLNATAVLVGAALAALGSWLVTRGQVGAARSEAEKARTLLISENKAQREHDAALAREERNHRRKEVAYCSEVVALCRH
jgi:hypothetical protein